MMRAKVLSMAGLGLALAARLSGADVWDAQTQNDNTVATQNELIHGSDQLHDLAALPGPAADQDFFRIGQKPYSSYEIVAEGIRLTLQRTDDSGVPLQTSQPVGVGLSRSLRWINASATAENTQRILVGNGVCGSDCVRDDVYRLRAYETTYAVPRFNNSGTQITILMIQNPASYTISGTVYFWSGSGAPAGTSPFTLAPKAQFVLQTQIVAPGSSGTITIAHDGRYGDLAGKAVSLEPATGFSFDTPIVPRVH